MKFKNIIAASLAVTCIMCSYTALVAYGDSSDVTLVIDTNTGEGPGGNTGGGPSGPGGNTGGDTGGDTGEGPGGGTGGNTGGNTGEGPGGGNTGGGHGGGNTGGSGEHANKPGNISGGEDGNGNDYYLRPGISVNKGIKDGYMVGKTDWRFDPDGYLTRAEFAVIVDRVFDFDNEKITKRFDDIRGHWAEDAICRLASNGVIQGVSSREFNPNGTLTHDQALQMLGRILYTDRYSMNTNIVELDDHYAKQRLSQMLNSGIYRDIPVNFDITSKITRDEMVQLINRIIYPKNLGNLDSVEDYLINHSIFKDLTSDTHDIYYKDSLKSLDKSYITDKLGGSMA